MSSYHKRFFFQEKGDKVVLDNPEGVRQAMQKVKNGFIIVEKLFKQRSVQQNAYYWGVVIYELSGYTGFTSDEMHEALKWQFLRIHSERGDIDSVKSTTDLSTTEFEDYLEQIRIWAASEFGVVIPEPNEISMEQH